LSDSREIDRALVERRAESNHAAFAGATEDRFMPLPGSVGLLVEPVEGLPFPEAVGIADEELALVEIEGHGVGRVSLNLESVRARAGGGIHDAQRALQRVVVIARHLGDHERNRFAANDSFSDLHVHPQQPVYARHCC
jgi:hypothetical protein